MQLVWPLFRSAALPGFKRRVSQATRGARRSMSAVKRVAIIGAGPSGVASAKHLLAENHFSQIDIFDHQARPGGVWDYVPENNVYATCSVPQTSPDVPMPDPIWRRREGEDGVVRRQATFVSPVYDRLEANIPKMLMQHSNKDFPPDDQLFPTHDQIEDYLIGYAKEVAHLIHWQTRVTTAIPTLTHGRRIWSVTTKNLDTLEEASADYDAILVASGHYNVPFLPSIPGIRAWNEFNPRIITHSKAYSNPEDFAGKKVLVVGNGPSGVDIAAQIATACQQPLLVSTRSDPNPVFQLPHARYVGAMDKFLPTEEHDRALRMTSGEVIDKLDAIVFCTGYIYSYPFLPQPPHSVPPFDVVPIITTGDRVHNVYKHIFYNADPTLAFLVLPWNIVPFPLAEGQGAVVARVWSGRLQLPNRDEMVEWERKGEEEWGKGKKFHRMPPPMDGQYVNELHDWAVGAKGETDEHLKPPRWDAKMMWIRKNVAHMKVAFMAKGEARHQIRTLEEIGFEYPGEDSVI